MSDTDTELTRDELKKTVVDSISDLLTNVRRVGIGPYRRKRRMGYGDITPVTSLARSLASLEAVGGMLFIAFLVGRLVGMYVKTPQENRG